jgi:hypothetical protein
MIRTRKIELNSDEFFYLLLTIYFKRRWLLLVWIWLVIFVLLFSTRISSVEYLLIAFLCLMQVLQIIQYWFYSHLKANAIYLLPRLFEITADQIVEWMDDGTSSTIKTDRFNRVIRTGKCYLLFLSKNEYVYLPFNAFESDTDRKWFETEIIGRIGKRSTVNRKDVEK